ncbi:DegT/DnrJ/EryC1/StrS family aminotransferase [Ottowia thiooxydans]|uniref:DegT/DnrJ/EryC1/StrS family aminotransferase n=1 Tax=Ottowia thiooxydans TaxID=219182 RepID=UPI0004176EA0|nr:DegT/DnrJ/EryC1/StrS family aminotransferase [Ottowia thiooxydans]
MSVVPAVMEVPLFCAASAAQGLDLPAVLREVVESQRYILGRHVQVFEEAFAAYVGVPHSIGVANGTDALEIALRALGMGPGRRVLTVANAGFYASTAIRTVGAEPVYAEIDTSTLNLSAEALSEALADQRLDAVVVTHLYGRLANMPAIAPLCRAAGVPLIEDCAQAHGARQAGRLAGAWGDVGCFSFYPTKNLGALGDGGALVTADKALAERMRALRQYGWGAKYEVAHEGGRNSRLDELQAAVLAAKLPLLDAANARRRAIAARYGAAFSHLPLQAPLADGEDDVAHLYVVRSARRDALRAHLASQGIASDVHYPVPDHRQPLLGTTLASLHLPATEAACAQILTLPCFVGMTDQQVGHVIAAVVSFHDGVA